MTIIIIGISFILIWFITTFFVVRYIKKLKNDLLNKFSNTEKSSEKESENIHEENEERGVKPFDFIKRADPENLLNYIRQEHPQIIALILAHLEPAKASIIMKKLPFELLGDVSVRIATLDRVSLEIIREIERVLEKKLSTLSIEDYFAVGGVENIVEILNHADGDSRDQIIREIAGDDPELAEEIERLSMERKPFRKFWEKLKKKPKHQEQQLERTQTRGHRL